MSCLFNTIILIGQNVQPIPSTLPSTLRSPKIESADKVKLGQPEDEVLNIMGRPPAKIDPVVARFIYGHSKEGDNIGFWPLTSEDTLVVVFENKKVAHIHHVNQNGTEYREIKILYEPTGFVTAESGEPVSLALATSEVGESQEHQAAVRAHDEIASDCALKLKDAASRVADATDTHRSLNRLEIEVRYYNAIRAACITGLAGASNAIQSADLCFKVYNQTIDKRSGDLTTREADQITHCKSMGLYPPRKD